MSTVSARRIRCKIDYAKRVTDQFTDAVAGSTPELWRGNDVRFEIGIFFGDSIITDISNLASLTLTIRDSRSLSATVRATKTLSAGDLTNCTAANWTDRTGQHAVVAFTGTEMNFTAGDTYWLAVSVETTDVPAKTITLGGTNFKLTEDAIGDQSSPESNLGTSYTKGESDARYVQKHEDQAWMQWTNGKWYVYHADTALWYPLICVVKDGVPMPDFGPGESL